MIKKITLIAVFALLFISCQKVVDAGELLETEETIYITGYISPQDTVLRVNVTKALPAIGTTLSVQDWEANESKFLIDNAEVTISDEAGNSTALTYFEENNSYLADATSLAITEGQNYFLQVLVDGTTYTASCQIPKKIETITTQINKKDNDFGGETAEIDITFTDIIGEKNFYILGGKIDIIYQLEAEGEEPQAFSYSLYFDTDQFQTEGIDDGGNISGKALSNVNDAIDSSESSITIQVTNVEEILYQNLKTASINAENFGNPLVEYAIAPNNIEEDGAIGVFAGYQLTEKTIEIEY